MSCLVSSLRNGWAGVRLARRVLECTLDEESVPASEERDAGRNGTMGLDSGTCIPNLVRSGGMHIERGHNLPFTLLLYDSKDV